MRDMIRVLIAGNEQHIPHEMVGFHATVELGARVGTNPNGLTLRRKADQAYLAASSSVGDILHDGDELEFVPHPGLRTAA